MVLTLAACGGSDTRPHTSPETNSNADYQIHLDKAEEYRLELDAILEGSAETSLLDTFVSVAYAQTAQLSAEQELKVAKLTKKMLKETELAIEASEKATVKSSGTSTTAKKAAKTTKAKSAEKAIKAIKNAQKKQATTVKKAAKTVQNPKVKKEVAKAMKTSKENADDLEGALTELEKFLTELESLSDEDLEALADFEFDIDTDLEEG